MTDPRPDDELVSGYLAGDAGAFSELVRRHQTRVLNLCLRMLGDPDDAADATQDAFLTALRKLGQFRGEAAFSTWMHRVAVNACYDIMRKRRRQPLLRTLEDEGPEPEFGPPVPDHAEEIAGTADVTQALMQVPEGFRSALILADLQDLPYEEIARILDLPVGTVKSRVHRGRVALAQAMGVRPRGEPGPLPRTSEEEA